MHITITFSHNLTDKTHVQSFLIQADTAFEASEVITPLLASVYAEMRECMHVTCTPGPLDELNDNDIVGSLQPCRTSRSRD